MEQGVWKNPWVRVVLGLLALAGVLFLAYASSKVLVPLAMAFLVAYMLDPVLDWFEARKVSRAKTIFLLASIMLIFCLAIPIFFVPSLIRQADGLINAATQQAQEGQTQDGLLQRLGDTATDLLHLDEIVDRAGLRLDAEGNPDPAMAALPATAVIGRYVGSVVRDNTVSFLQVHGRELATISQGAGLGVASFFASLGSSLVGIVVFLANFAVFAFVGGYLLKDFDGVVGVARELAPPRYRATSFRIISQIDVQLHSFVRGQMAVCFCLGLLYAIGLGLCGVPFWFLIALIGGFAGFVPFLGAFLTIGPAIVLTLLQYQFDWHIVAVLVWFGIVQFVEGNILTPNIVGNQVGLHPVWVILAVLVFGSALGLLGMVIAVPLAAALKVLIVEGVQYYKTSALFTGPKGPFTLDE